MEVQEAIEKIKERYPDILPNKEVSSYQLGYLIGQQSIVSFLSSLEDFIVKQHKKK